MRKTLPRPARLALRLAAVSGLALATANCATAPKQTFAAGNGLDPKYGVKASPRLYNEGDEIPKGGGRRYTGKPYVVAGQTYTPREDPRGYVRDGLASWYGAAFHGRQTANGEVFDRHSIAAAHPTLPLPSYARVTNLDNGYSMVVRVNDRGPYHANRVMDVSEEAATALGFQRKGTAHVRVEYVGKASIAGSDDRKLMASLRTDGSPAGRANVIVADLGPTEEPERFSRTAPAPLAFKPVPERDEAPAPRPVRAPIVLASAAVAVPAAVQPTAVRAQAFRPAPVQVTKATVGEVKVAGMNPGGDRRAAADPANPARPHAAQLPARFAADPKQAGQNPAVTKPIQAQAAMPVSSKLVIAKLATAAPPLIAPGSLKGGVKPGAQWVAAKAGVQHARLAEIY